MGQHLQRHVLKGAGGAVPQLQTVGVLIHSMDWGDGRGIKLIWAVGSGSELRQLLDGEPVQEELHHIDRSGLIGHVLQIHQAAAGQLGHKKRSQQTTVPGQTLGDRLGCRILLRNISSADILHIKPSIPHRPKGNSVQPEFLM